MYAWNPWSLFDELHQTMGSSEWPQFDIEDTEDETILTADLPGMTEDDIELVVQGPILVVRGERKLKDGRYAQRRRFYGSFARQFRLGDTYDLDRVKANLANGVLTIELAKAARAKPRRIKLTSGVVDKVKGLLGGSKEHDKAA